MQGKGEGQDERKKRLFHSIFKFFQREQSKIKEKHALGGTQVMQRNGMHSVYLKGKLDNRRIVGCGQTSKMEHVP